MADGASSVFTLWWKCLLSQSVVSLNIWRVDFQHLSPDECRGVFTHLENADFLLHLDTCLLVLHSLPLSPFHTPPSAWFGEKKNTIGHNHQQHHYDVLFYKEPHWQPFFSFFTKSFFFFLSTSLKSTRQRERHGAFIKTQPFCAPLFVWPDSYHCTESPRTTKLCLKAKLLISCRNIFWIQM